MANEITVLYLFESVIPHKMTASTLGFGELGVIAQVPGVARVVGIGRSGNTYYESRKATQGKSDNKKIQMIKVRGTSSRVMYWLSPIWLFLAGWRFLLTHKIRVIHAESCYLSGLAALALGRLFQIPVVIEYHVTYETLLKTRFKMVPLTLKKRLWETLSREVNKRAAAIAANCRLGADSFYRQGFRNKTFYYNPEVNIRLYPRRNQTLTMSYIGRLYEDKGAGDLLQAISLCREKLHQKEVRILIAGDGPQRQQLEEYVKAEKLTRVTFLGTTDRWRVLAETDYLINTTKVMAALEMVIVEALALGIPTIAYSHGLYPETVIDSITGFKVPSGDKAALARIMALCAEGKPPKELVSGAKTHFVNNYELGSQVKRVAQMYDKIIDL